MSSSSISSTRTAQTVHGPTEELRKALTSYGKVTAIVKELLIKGAHASEKDENGLTPLHYACLMEDKLETIPLLLGAKAEIDARSEYGSSPLHFAALNNLRMSVRYLIYIGATVDLENNDGLTPLMSAAEKGKTDAVEILLQAGANPNHRALASHSVTPLHVAAVGKRSTVSLLLKHDANVNAVESNFGFAPLHIAAERERTKIVTALIEGGAEIDLKDECGETPLYRAVEMGRLKTAKLLIKHKASIHTTNNKGKNLFTAAKKSGSSEMEKLIKIAHEIIM